MAAKRQKKASSKQSPDRKTMNSSKSNKTFGLVLPVGILGIAFAAAFVAQQPQHNDASLPILNSSSRPQPIVELMSADLASQYEISNPEDISPYVKYLEGPPIHQRRDRAMGARFRSFCPFPLTMWWDNGTPEGVYSGFIKPHGDSSTNTYTSHTFHFRRQDTGEQVASFTMNDDTFLYIIGPLEGDSKTLESKRYKDTLAEIQFLKKYHKENGVPWLSHYPRPPPVVFMYPADFPGQVHKVRSFIGYHDDNGVQQNTPVDFNITVISAKPKVLLIKNLLSKYEIDHIISKGVKVVKGSMVGSGANGFASNTRTSENGWIKRKSSEILDKVYYRFGDVLGMTDEQLQDDTRGGIIENLQFVRYLKDQKYDAHHDFGNTGTIYQRFSTLLIYLMVPEKGGGTSFPKAFNGQGISVKPSAGDAVLFYSMLEDGNGDDMSLHSGMPVESGLKYVCNLWSWDPLRTL
mmetsp:Transcript_873/g.951  ORF Transcript_873/g.951 Transcript_873/m.951 type:complete len:463 (+) Transcript_873:89-1477(+)|eukprot:CAMPEP_0184015056 /NCGR_PEP_ID=MMETSP0954-20121128/6077_1 /TAXON_ID=627963 /ORGANISM="Aplanochytrium sp, Strain PBS07" /LENGTH=462 /DNA_ID=CAMNT_0026295755 /DNA_START=47 /DNA_END=1435 /DNA_ORIENTATION=-